MVWHVRWSEIDDQLLVLLRAQGDKAGRFEVRCGVKASHVSANPLGGVSQRLGVGNGGPLGGIRERLHHEVRRGSDIARMVPAHLWESVELVSVQADRVLKDE